MLHQSGLCSVCHVGCMHPPLSGAQSDETFENLNAKLGFQGNAHGAVCRRKRHLRPPLPSFRCVLEKAFQAAPGITGSRLCPEGSVSACRLTHHANQYKLEMPCVKKNQHTVHMCVANTANSLYKNQAPTRILLPCSPQHIIVKRGRWFWQTQANISAKC